MMRAIFIFPFILPAHKIILVVKQKVFTNSTKLFMSPYNNDTCKNYTIFKCQNHNLFHFDLNKKFYSPNNLFLRISSYPVDE